jgi:hypothetical protein
MDVLLKRERQTRMIKQHHNFDVHPIPSPREITLRCRQIQMEWSPAERLMRIVRRSPAWLAPLVRGADMRLELDCHRTSGNAPQSQAGQRQSTQQGT